LPEDDVNEEVNQPHILVNYYAVKNHVALLVEDVVFVDLICLDEAHERVEHGVGRTENHDPDNEPQVLEVR
jgi:hypothetical protein